MLEAESKHKRASSKRKRASSQSSSPAQKKGKPPGHRSGAYYKPSRWGESVGPDDRLILKGELGKGTSSVVFRCLDTALPAQEYAVKFIRLSTTLRKATENEIKLLRRMQSEATSSDPEGAKRLLGLASMEVFEHQGHLALVFERQKCCLRTALKKYGQGGGLSLLNLQSVAKDVFLALRALKQIGIIHCDLKPANLLVSLDGKSVRLADFGSATGLSTRTITDQVQPLYYRAPEVILGQAFGTGIDIWSAGLTLFQLATGDHLMKGKSNNAMLHAMLNNFGALPKSFCTAGKFAAEHFNNDGSFRLGYGYAPMSDFPTRASLFHEELAGKIKQPAEGSSKQRHVRRLQQLGDLCSLCVVPEPTKRATPEDVLGHGFVQF